MKSWELKISRKAKKASSRKNEFNTALSELLFEIINLLEDENIEDIKDDLGCEFFESDGLCITSYNNETVTSVMNIVEFYKKHKVITYNDIIDLCI